MSSYRLAHIPPPVLRLARSRAAREGTTLDAVLLAALRAYAEETDLISRARQGGHARREALSPERRRDIAQRAGQARWRRTDP